MRLAEVVADLGPESRWSLHRPGHRPHIDRTAVDQSIARSGLGEALQSHCPPDVAGDRLIDDVSRATRRSNAVFERGQHVVRAIRWRGEVYHPPSSQNAQPIWQRLVVLDTLAERERAPEEPHTT